MVQQRFYVTQNSCLILQVKSQVKKSPVKFSVKKKSSTKASKSTATKKQVRQTESVDKAKSGNARNETVQVKEKIEPVIDKVKRDKELKKMEDFLASLKEKKKGKDATQGQK